MFKLFDTVALAHDLQASGLMRGDLGAVVHVHGPDAFEVEFVAASGRTLALLTLQGRDLRALGDRDLLRTRGSRDAAALSNANHALSRPTTTAHRARARTLA